MAKNQMNPEEGKSLNELLQIRHDKLAALQQEGRDPFRETKYDVTHHSADILAQFDALEGQTVSVAGRLVSKRGMGKVSFCDLLDRDGKIQLYVRRDLVGGTPSVVRSCGNKQKIP